jgi:GT2 family glycosyltransferase
MSISGAGCGEACALSSDAPDVKRNDILCTSNYRPPRMAGQNSPPRCLENDSMTGSSQDTWVSVIIVCHNDGRWLPRCLESLRQQTLFVHLEIILVDNASQDGTDKLAQELIAGWDNARFIASGGDRGYCFGINLGAKVAKGRYLYLFNTDTWLEPDCLERLHKAAEAGGAAGAGSLILNYEDDSVQAKGSNGFDLFGNPVSPRGGRDPEVLFCIAGFYFIRREVFFELGMLDERLFMYGEEMDLSWRIWLSGRKIIPVMEARVHHRGAAGVNPAGGNRVVENPIATGCSPSPRTANTFYS